jgi:hypothetical protein
MIIIKKDYMHITQVWDIFLTGLSLIELYFKRLSRAFSSMESDRKDKEEGLYNSQNFYEFHRILSCCTL